jgi:hypothetical protein
MLNSDIVKQKLEIMRELEFTKEEFGIFLKKFPKLLGLSDDKLWQKLKFILEE